MPIKFTPSESKRIFVGRDTQLTDFEDILLNDKRREWIVHIPGDGGIGKTRLLERLRGIAQAKLADRLVVNGLIDFYDTNNRSSIGLLHSIANQLGFERFDEEHRKFQEYLKTDSSKDRADRHNRFERLKKVFFSEYRALLTRKERVLLVFDTCEEMWGVDGWFQTEFLGGIENIETGRVYDEGGDVDDFQHQTLVIIAGRQEISLTPYDSKGQVAMYRLPELSQDAVRTYLQSDEKVVGMLGEEEISRLYERTGGRPLYVALTFDWLWNEVGTVDELLAEVGEFRDVLVNWVRRLEPRKKMAILFMALAWRRMEYSLLGSLLELDEKATEKVIEELAPFSFVKHRTVGELSTLNLHDEMRDLVNATVWPKENEPGSPLPLGKVLDWYLEQIDNPELLAGTELPDTERERALLAEWLHYQYRVDLDAASSAYDAIYRNAAHNLDLTFGDMLNHEVERFEDLLPKYEKDNLRFRQALVAFKNGNYDKAGDIWHAFLRDKDMDAKLRATSLMLLVELDSYSGKPDEAIGHAEEAEQVYLELIDSKTTTKEKQNLKKELGQLYNNWGYACRVKDDYEKALQYYLKALKISSKKSQSPKHKARVLNNIGFLYYRLGQIIRARTYVGQALSIRQEMGIPYELGLSHNTMGMILYDYGRVQEAVDQYEKALRAFDDSGDSRGTALALINLGRVQRVTNDYERALDYLGQARQTFEHLGDKDYLITVLNELGCTYRQEGDLEKSLEFLGKSLQYSQELGKSFEQLDNLDDISVTYYQLAASTPGNKKIQDEYIENARTYAGRVKELIGKADGERAFTFMLAKAERTLGDLAYLEEEYDEAFERYFESSLMMARAWMLSKRASVFLQRRYEEALDRLQEQLHALAQRKGIDVMMEYVDKMFERLSALSPAEKKVMAQMQEYLKSTKETARLVQ